MNARKPKIVVLGAGYAGLRCILDLIRFSRAGRLQAEITLVDRSPYHQLVTLLHKSATEAVPAEESRLPLAEVLPGEVRFLCAEVNALRLAEGSIETNEGWEPFDYLVVAVGSETYFPPIPGLEEHALRLRWWNDAEEIRVRVRRAFEKAGRAPSPKARESFLRIVVVGGGFTGCQLAGELSHWVTDLADEFRVPVGEIHLLLVEVASSLMPGGEAGDSAAALRILRRKGVDVRLGSPVRKVSESKVTFGGATLGTRTVIWTGGIRAPEFLARSGLKSGQQGRLLVDRSLRAVGHPRVYVAGDCALYDAGGRILPGTAALAMRQGSYLAGALVEVLAGESAAPYLPSDTGILVSLGGDDAVGDLLGVPFQGLAACTLKEAIERWYAAGVAHNLPVLF